MKTVSIDGHLDQAKLETALREIVGEAGWRGREVRAAPRRFRWDMVFERGGALIAVEYDGDEHYRHSLKIKADREKDEFARTNRIKVVRFPYWVQLTTETLRHYFDLEGTVVQNFSHGFITTKFFPASFCELGLIRFRSELDSLPKSVRCAVLDSLRARADEHGLVFVLPGSLTVLLGGPR
jgi:hypothetical protein